MFSSRGNIQRERSYEYNQQPSTSAVNSYERQQDRGTSRSCPSTRSIGKFYYNDDNHENTHIHHVRYFDQNDALNTTEQNNDQNNNNQLTFFRP